MPYLMALAIGTMFGIGIFLVLRRNLLRSAIGLVILSNAVNLFLLCCGAYDGVTPAYTTAPGPRADALPQALILTAIVISMGGLAFVLALLGVLAHRERAADADAMRGLRH